MDKGIFDRNPSGSKRRRTASDDASTFFDFHRGAVIVSVVENRGREVCICKMDTLNISQLEIFLHLDGHSYNETILELSMLHPDEILLHDGVRDKALSQKITKKFGHHCRIVNISRQYFDQDRGAEMLRRVVTGKVDTDIVAKYTVLAGSFCILKYVENCRGSNFSVKSIRMVFQRGSTGRMQIDRKTAFHLELVMNAKSGNPKESLFGVINNTKTSVGARLLRSNILSPLSERESIIQRQNLVEYFLRNSETYDRLVTTINQFPDLDKMLNGLTYRPKSLTINTARVGIDTLLYIKKTIQLCEEMACNIVGQTTGSDGVLLVGVSLDSLPLLLPQAIDAFRQPALTSIHKLICELLVDDASFSKSNQEMRFQECFSVSPGVDGFLDAARKLYLQSVEDIYAAAEEIEKAVGFSIKVAYSSTRGYYLSVPIEVAPLPNIFIQPVQARRSILCSTLAISSLSDRALEAMDQCILLTNQLIQAHLTKIQEDIDALFRLTDCVALLDMLLSFTDMVALSSLPFTRPDIATEGSIVLKGARHPVIEALSMHSRWSAAERHFVPNDVWVDDIERMSIVTGPNGAGKTIYIKQVALITIMAQMGCFVPCKEARINIRRALLSRLGTNDDMENNMSTFATEMNDAAYILDHADADSLVLIDELGRGTCIVDGISLAFAIAEKLLALQPFVLFVTHFPQLTELANMYPFVRNVHMKTSLVLIPDGVTSTSDDTSTIRTTSMSEGRNAAMPPTRSSGRASIEFLHEAASGCSDMNSNYGILMSEICQFPPSVVQDAREFRQRLGDLYPIRFDADFLQQQPQFVLFKLLQKIRQVVDSSGPSEGSVDTNGLRLNATALSKLQRIMQRVSEPERHAVLELLDQVSMQISANP